MLRVYLALSRLFLFGVDILLHLTAGAVSLLFLFLDYTKSTCLRARFHFESLFGLFCYPFFIVLRLFFNVLFSQKKRLFHIVFNVCQGVRTL